MTTEDDILQHRRVQVFRDRFETMYAKAGPDDCWLWTAYCSRRGYGLIRLVGKNFQAHRVSYAFKVGPIPPGDSWDGEGGFTKTLVLHRCDVKKCVNPRHLFLGSTDDNVQDKIKKGRENVRGVDNAHAKLTPEQVRAIRADPRFQADIAADYGVNQQSVSNVKNRRTWAHIP